MSKKFRIVPTQRKIRLRVNDWTPALHPRDPETGKFVERPYSVPDDIAGMNTRDIVNELASMNPDFEDMAQGVAVDVTGDDGTAPEEIQNLIDSTQTPAGSGRFDVGDEITVDTERQGEISGSVVEHNPEFDELILETDDGDEVVIPEGEISSMPEPPGVDSDPLGDLEGDEFGVNAWSASLAQTSLNRMVHSKDMPDRFGDVQEKMKELKRADSWDDGSATVKLTELERNRIEEALRDYKDVVDGVVEEGRSETLMLRNPQQTQTRLQTAIAEFATGGR